MVKLTGTSREEYAGSIIPALKPDESPAPSSRPFYSCARHVFVPTMVMHALSATSMRRQSAICCWAVRSALSTLVWFLILGSFGLVNMMPNPEDEILEWGLLLPRSRVGEMLSSAFDPMMLLVAWSLWKERNARIFRNKVRTPDTSSD